MSNRRWTFSTALANRVGDRLVKLAADDDLHWKSLGQALISEGVTSAPTRRMLAWQWLTWAVDTKYKGIAYNLGKKAYRELVELHSAMNAQRDATDAVEEMLGWKD